MIEFLGVCGFALAALVAGSLLITAAIPTSLADELKTDSTAKRVIALNLGAMRAITVPPTWQAKGNKVSGALTFIKASSGPYDCEMTVDISRPFAVTPEQNKVFDDLAHHPNLTQLQMQLFESFPASPNGMNASKVDEVSGRTTAFDGRTALLIERRGVRHGPCQATASGGTRMPLLNLVNGCVYLRFGANSMQTVSYDVTVMGNTKPCVDSIWQLLRTIEWNKDSKL